MELHGIEKARLREEEKECLAATPIFEHQKEKSSDLDPSNDKLGNNIAPLPSCSAPSTVKIIENINAMTYPVGISSPAAHLNRHAKDGKFRYDRRFLLQFMNICKKRPDNFPQALLDMIGSGLEPKGVGKSRTRGKGSSGRHRKQL
ncbi:hypothetical protein H0H81_000413 [Sphagnurus paluster]|uniref:Eukaryotic translation initiation factor 4G1 eIF4E-binding domain-containing protein n=1 Tax=Sphagnurus paluster TaxID=117069 RepID=A0A9P7FN24_9AGAR|nr:hypothetical protein H0H81_000413 [Sphagnurus paluster]